MNTWRRLASELPTEDGGPRVYTRLAEHLRTLILNGRIPIGERLPSEADLSVLLGVGRSSIREALRILAAQHLILTTRGPGGGNIVVLPSQEQVTGTLTSMLRIMIGSDDCTIHELVQTRLWLEVPTARLAAERRSEVEVDAARKIIPASYRGLTVAAIYGWNLAFHRAVLAMSRNRAAAIISEAAFAALQSGLHRERMRSSAWNQVLAEHVALLKAIEMQDGLAAQRLMEQHLTGLGRMYKKMSVVCG